jgi:hypothetical protein
LFWRKTSHMYYLVLMLVWSWWLRYQSKEVKIQIWERCQKSKFEAKIRNAEDRLLPFLNFRLKFWTYCIIQSVWSNLNLWNKYQLSGNSLKSPLNKPCLVRYFSPQTLFVIHVVDRYYYSLRPTKSVTTLSKFRCIYLLDSLDTSKFWQSWDTFSGMEGVQVLLLSNLALGVSNYARVYSIRSPCLGSQVMLLGLYVRDMVPAALDLLFSEQ